MSQYVLSQYSLKLLFISSLLTLTACGSDDPTNESNTSQANTSLDDTTEIDLSDSGPTEVEGVWVTDCLATHDINFYTNTRIEFRDNNWNALNTYFNDSGCTEAASLTPLGGTFAIGEQVIPSSGLPYAKKVDITINLADDNKHVLYDIFRVTDDTLYFGDRYSDYNRSTEDLRPIDLFFDSPYFKE